MTNKSKSTMAARMIAFTLLVLLFAGAGTRGLALRVVASDEEGVAGAEQEAPPLAEEAMMAQTVYINSTTFPDDIFRSVVLTELGISSAQGEAGIDASMFSTVTYLDVSGKGIASLKGIEYFSALGVLDCNSNRLTSLDVSGNRVLFSLTCSMNMLGSLDVSNNKQLTRLFCADNPLGSLDVRQNTELVQLSCINNGLTSLDVSKNTMLSMLVCSENSLSSLDLGNNTQLETLECNDNLLGSLDLTKNPLISGLQAVNNPAGFTVRCLAEATDVIGYCEENSIPCIYGTPVTAVALNTTSATLEVNKTLQLTATVSPSNAANKTLRWTSSNDAVATVSDTGLVTAKAAGSATITVRTVSGSKTAVCSITVTSGTGGTAKTPDELTKDFIARAYQEILCRSADTSGMNYWFGQLKSKTMGGGQMCAQFLASKEFQNRKYGSAKKVEICYRTFFNRDANADASGKKYWTDLLDNGVSESYIARGMAGSTEFKNVCARYGIAQGDIPLTENRDKNTKVTAFVARCYKESLGRAGDKGGLNYWTGEILSKRITPAKTAEGFVFSKEMNSKGYNNSQFIQMLYRLCMGRTYDQGGLNYWLGKMNNGMTRQQVFQSFVNSTEFRNIVKSYGL